jgi:hypothetical protein
VQPAGNELDRRREAKVVEREYLRPQVHAEADGHGEQEARERGGIAEVGGGRSGHLSSRQILGLIGVKTSGLCVR